MNHIGANLLKNGDESGPKGGENTIGVPNCKSGSVVHEILTAKKSENFRVDISELDKSGDIVEYKDGLLRGEQLFTCEAALREVEKQNKKIPTYDEFLSLVKEIGIDEFIKKCPGYYHNKHEKTYMSGEASYFLTHSEDTEFQLHVFLKQNGAYEHFSYYLNETDINIGRFSVYCI